MRFRKLTKSIGIGNRAAAGVDLSERGRYLCAMRRAPGFAALTLVASLWLVACPRLFAQEAQASSVQASEYMIYQYPRVSLVVVIDVRETEFEARIEGPEGAPVSETGVAARRIGPVYQFIDSVDTPRQLMIEVNPGRRIERSRISMELLQLPDSDRHSQSLARAYRYLAHGMKPMRDGGRAAWAERTYSLQNAARTFAGMGMEEMRLWSEYYATHLVLYELEDVLQAIERIQAVRAGARRAGFQTIELATLILEADARMLAGEKSSGEAALAHYAEAHPAWEQVDLLAAELGYVSERGRALYRDGLAWERQHQLERAIERYEQALDVMTDAGDPDLLNRVRATAASAYEQRGSTSGAISLLEDIAGDLPDSGLQAGLMERAANLHEKGRLLNSSYRFSDAVPELEAALSIRKQVPADDQWGLTGLELGWAFWSLGYLEEAGAIIRESLPRTPLTELESRARALGVLAGIARAGGQLETMAAQRERQGDLVGAGAGRAAFLFESALDAIARDGPGSSQALRLLQSAREASAGADWITAHRATLEYCLQRLLQQDGSACDSGRAEAAYRALRRSGIPEVEVDASLASVRLLRLLGRRDEARGAVERLADDVQFYRELLPGVVSAWYWASRASLFAEYLALHSGAGTGAMDLLLALERIRAVDRAVGDGTDSRDAVRNPISRADAARPAPDAGPSKAADEQIAAFRSGSGWTSGALTRARLEARLGSLGRGDTVLAIHFAPETVYAVTADRSSVKRHRLAARRDVDGQLEAARSALLDPSGPAPVAGLDRLGRLLLVPMADELGERLMLLSSGPLNGFPFDALRIDGAYLAERHRVVYIDGLENLPGETALPREFPATVFVAGNPRSGRDLFSYGVTTSEEIEAVRDRFVGTGLHIVQGVALRGDEFEDARYMNADLIHLAMPGRVDLARPGRSRLLLSGDRESPSAEFLSSEQMRRKRLQAELAVLSGLTFGAGGGTDFDSRIGLVSDLQASGARQVMASLWPLEDADGAAFMADFYTALEEEQDVSEALFQTRRARITSKDGTNLRSWAGFQLYIR
jgi:CHAT domain-containing protein/tetratricopeptide (TPR) repeat protein